MTTVRLISEERTTPRRVRLLETPIALVEDVHAEVAGGWVGAEGFSPEFQLALPYQGLFVWEVGHDSVVGDANQVLCHRRRRGLPDAQPASRGYGELIVTPGESLLDEITGGRASIARVHPLFRRRSRRIEPGLQLARARFLARAREGGETLEAEEQMVWLLRTALADERLSRPPSRCTQRLVDRTKTYLASELGRSIQLAEIARAVGASPGYLTQLFRAVEGVPLHAYLTQLRLAQALIELPRSEDLTALALELGFSSHSHFSARFRRAFGLSPSAFRRACRPPLPRA